MLDVNGILTMTKKAGNASSKSSHLISEILLIIKQPTIIKLGAVIAATSDTEPIIGLKNAAITNRTTTVNDVKPVFPPAPTPAEDSTVAQSDLFPNIAPTIVPIESAENALPPFSNLPFLIRPACLTIASKAPVVSNNMTSKNEKMTL